MEALDEAAQGEVLNNDDIRMKILQLMKANEQLHSNQEAAERLFGPRVYEHFHKTSALFGHGKHQGCPTILVL